MTVGAVLKHPVERVDAFEIEPAVVEASRFFEPENGKPLEDPRLDLVLGDARGSSPRAGPYDLIINEPSNPWLTGVANLFTAILRARREPAHGGRRPVPVVPPLRHVGGLHALAHRDVPERLPPRHRFQAIGT